MRPVSRGDLQRLEHLGPRLRGRVADVPQVRAEAQRPVARHGRLLLHALPRPGGDRPVRLAGRAAVESAGSRPAKASRASPATACNTRTANRTASGASKPATIFAPVFGGIGGDGVADAIHRKDQLKVKTSPDEKGPGQNIHAAGVFFQPLTQKRVLHAVPPGGRAAGHQARSRVGAVPRIAGVQEGHPMPGLPHGPRAGPAARATTAAPSPRSATRRSTTTARNRTTSSTARTTRSPTPASFRST